MENLDQARALLKLDPTEGQTVDERNVLLGVRLAGVVRAIQNQKLFIFRLLADHQVEQSISKRENVFTLGHLKVADSILAGTVGVREPGSEGCDLESGVLGVLTALDNDLTQVELPVSQVIEVSDSHRMRHLDHVLEHKFAELGRDGALNEVDAKALDTLENVGCVGPVLHQEKTVLVVFKDLPGLNDVRRPGRTLHPSVDHPARVCVVFQVLVHFIFGNDFDHVLLAFSLVVESNLLLDASDHALYADKTTNLHFESDGMRTSKFYKKRLWMEPSKY